MKLIQGYDPETLREIVDERECRRRRVESEHQRSLRVPARQSSCPAFVGPDLSRLLVTSAWQGMTEEGKRDDPDHGRTFVLDAAARGRAEPDVTLAD